MDIVAREGDVSIIILLTLFYIQINIDGIGIESEYRIPYDFSIPIALSIGKGYNTVFIVAEIVANELRSVEKVQLKVFVNIGNYFFIRNGISVNDRVGCSLGCCIKQAGKKVFKNMNPGELLRPLHLLFDAAVRNIVIPLNSNLIDLNLAALVHVKTQLHTVGQGCISFLNYLYCGIQVSFVNKIVSDFTLSVVLNVFSNNSTPNLYFLLKFTFLGLIDTGKFYAAESGSFSQFQQKINIISFYLGHQYFNIADDSLRPKLLKGIGDSIAWHTNLIVYFKA